jgi:peptidoglycan/xylan/chitin deacetylase (PgdA/CDA1 family)
MLWTVLAVFVILVGLTYAPGVLLRRLQIEKLRQRCKGRLVLTYDDGPGIHITPKVLQILERNGAKATFFLTGFRAANCPKIWKDATADGYDIGSHAYWHHDAWRTPFRGVASVVKGCRQIASLPGTSRLFRPPHGRATTWSYLAAKLCGFRHAYWTVDSGDWLQPPVAVEDVIAEVRRSGGGVLLMHDSETGEAGEEQRHKHLLSLTEQLITLGRLERWDICTMSELMNESKRGFTNG